MNLFFYFKDTNKRLETWQPSTTSAQPATAYDYKRTFTTPDGNIVTNRAIDVKNILSPYVYRNQQISSTLNEVAGFSKLKCNLYIKVAGDSNFTKLSSSNDLGVGSGGTVTINCNKRNSDGSQPSSGAVSVILDIDSGYPTSKVKVTTTLNNITFENAINEVDENSDFTFNFSANQGYQIDTLTTNLGSVNIAGDKLTATITGKATGDIIINGSANLIPIEKHYVQISGTLNNCYCSYENNEEISNIKPCEIIANSGYIFPTQISYPYTAIINDIEVVKYASVIDNGYRLHFDFSFGSNISTIILNDDYTAVKEVDNISDFVNTYYVTKQTLKELAKKRFLKLSSESGVTYVDLGEFIVGLYVLPLGVPDILITSEQNIKLGYQDSKVPANVINAYKWEYDLGVITIPAKYNNAYDFIKTEVFLNAPFFDQQELPIYTIGHDIHIKILFDCYSGSGTLLVKDTFTNSYIVNKTRKIVIDVPYVQTGLNTVFNKLGNTNVNPLIDTCFVSVIRNTPYNNDNEYGKNLNASVVIGSVQGYAEFSKSTVISTIATDTELEMINRLLANGVYIN